MTEGAVFGIMGRKRAIILLICIFGFVNAFANTAPYFTAAVEDTNLTEDAYWSVWLNAADDDGDPYTFDFASGAPDGMTINTSSGRITWTPDNDDVGTHRIEVSVSDGSLTDYMTFFLHVHNLNDPPYWVNTTADTVTVAEDSELDITVTANDDDLPHGDHIFYSITRGENVTVNSSTGSISGSPDNSNVGYQTVTVRARDDSSAAVEWSFVLETSNTAVEFTNTPPTETNEDDYFSFDLSSNDEGQGNTVYYFQSGFQPEWLSLNATNGVINGTPNNGYVGTSTVKIIVDDDNGSTDTLAYDFTVVNRKPVITTSTLHSATEDAYFFLDINADDEGLGSTTYRFLDDLLAHPDWLSLNTDNGVIAGTPTNAHVGSNSFYLEFDDGNGGKDTTQFVVNVVNDPVRIDTTNLVYDISEDQEYYYKFTSNDDGQGSISYHGIGLPDWLTINLSSGVLRGTPNNENVGDFDIAIYVSDGTDADTVNYTIHVENRVPQQETADVKSVNEDSDYYYDMDFDDEGEGQVYQWVIKPSWLSLDTNTGELTGSPDNSNVGDTTVSIRVNDGNGGLVVNTFNLNVINRNPVFTPQADTTITQDTDFGVSLTTDDDNDPEVIYSWVEGPPESALSSEGLIQWTPDNSMVGVANFEVRATDNHGGSSTLAFTVTVTNLNPVISSSPPTTVEENSNYVYDVQSNEEGIGDVTYSLTTAPDWLSIVESTGYIEGTPGNSDVGTHNVTVRVDDGNSGYVTQSWTITVTNISPTITNNVLDTAVEDSAYSYQITTYPANEGDLTFSLVGDHPDWISINALSGVLSGTPTNSDVTQAVKDSITVRVVDEHGGSGEKKFELIINNSLPVFTTTSDITVVEDEALNWDINTNDEGDEGPNASGYNLVTAPDWMTINSSTGVLSGTPLDDDVGTNAVSIRYQDGNSGVVELNVNVIISNDPPAITSLNPTTAATEDAAYSFQFTSDDDDRGFVVYSSLYDLPADLTLSTDGLLSGTPKNTAVGNQSIGIIATDKNSGKDTLIYTLTIANAESPITACTVSESPYTQTADTFYVTEDLPYSVDFTASDEEDGSSALYTVNHKPAWMTVKSLTKGQLEGTPDNRHVGQDYVDITFSDGNGYSDTKRVYFQVQNVISDFIDPPASVTATEDVAFTLDLNSSDEGQGTITYSITAGDPGWITLNSTTGAISGTPDNDDVTDGVDITFQVTDGNGGTATKTIVFIVENTNDDPTWSSAPVSGSTVTTAEDALYSVDIDAADVDVGDNITYSLTEKPSGMTINSSTGEITWTPDNSQVGDHLVTVKATDSESASITRYWTVQVTNVTSAIEDPLISDFSPSDDITTIIDTFYIWEDSYYTLNLDADDEGLGETSVVKYSFGAFDNPDWIRISDVVSGKIIIRPTNEDVGLDSFKVFFTDYPGSRDTLTMYLRVQNLAPTLASAGPFTIQEDQEFNENIHTSDKENGNVSFSFYGSSPGWLSIETISPDSDPSDSSDFNTYEIPFDFPTIQQGIDAAVNGDLVLVHPGTYYENINIEKSITVASLVYTTGDTSYISQTIIDGNQIGRVVTLNDGADNAVLRGFTIQNGKTSSSGAGVYCYGDADLNQLIIQNNYASNSNVIYMSRGTLRNSKIINNNASNIAYISSDGNQKIENVYIANNTCNYTVSITSSGAILKNVNILKNNETYYSIYIYSGNPVLNNLTISDNSGKCVWAGGGTTPVFKNTVFDFDGSPVISISGENTAAEFYYSNIVQGEGSINVYSGGTYIVGDNCIFTDPLFVDPDNGDYSLQDGSPCIDAGDPDTDDDGISWEADADDQDDDGTRLDMGAKPFDISYDESTDIESVSAYAVLSGTPTNSDIVSDAAFSIKVTDGNGGEDIKSYSFSVVNVNDPPEFTAVPSGVVSINQDETYTTDIDATDPDPGDNLVYSLVDSSEGMTINTSSGIISWTPNNDQVGDNVITVKARDSGGRSVTSSWTIRVNNLNDAPTWVSVPNGTIDTNEDEEYSVTVEAEDIDAGDNITYSLVTAPGDMTIDPASGQIAWTPDNDDVGLHDITVKATDSSASAITADWTLNVLNVNDDPVWSSVPAGTVTSAEDAAYTVDVDASDVDAGDVITYSLTAKPAGMSINSATGVISWTPDNSDVGDHTITVKATDLSGGSVSRSYKLQITNVASAITAPVAGDFAPSAAVTATADTFYIKEDTTYTLNLSAPDENVGVSSAYSFDDFANPEWITLSDAATGIVSLTPTNGDVGLDSFLVYFQDQPGSRDTLTVYLRVENVAPEILTEGPFAATEGAAFSQQLASSDDGDGTISWSFVSGKPDWLAIDANTGLLSGTPADADVISDGVFTVKVDDGNSGIAQKEYTYSVANVNNSPVWTSIPDGTVAINEDSPYSVTISADDPDLDNGDIVTYSLVNPPAGMTINGSTGQISWTPDNSHVGSNSITVKATDTGNISIISNYKLNVVNTAPVISALSTDDFEPAGTVTVSADTFFVWEDSSYTVNFTASDEGLGDGAVYRTSSLSNPDWVTLTNSTAGTVQLEPINKDVGLDSFRVVFDDGNATDTAQIYIRVRNNPPRMIAAGPFSATEDEAFDVDLESTDEDASSSYSFVGDYPSWMSINASTGLITGTPTNDAVGTSTFTVRVNDGHGGTDDQLYTINVANTSDPPIISSTAPTTAMEDVLYLYDLEATDQDGDPINYRLVIFPEGMTIDTSSGLIRWTPDNNYGGGTVSVKATVEDTSGFPVEQVWEITITNAAPNFLTADAAFNATEDTEFTVDLSVDDEGQGLTNYTVIHLPGWLSLTNSSTGIISGTPDNSYVNSSDSVYIEFSDGNGGKDTLNVPVNVANVAPVFTTQADTLVNEAEAVAIDLNCDDETAGGVSYSAQSPLPGWLTLNGSTGELTGTPANSDIGAHTISIRATDAFSGFATMTFLITVQNVAPAFTGTPLNTIEEDSLYEYTLTISDDSGANTFQILTNPGWLTINSSSGKLSGTALNNHVGDNSVSVRVEDGNGAADTLDFVITVTNSVPEFTTAPVTTGQEDIQYSLDLNSSDEGQGTMIYTALRMPEWLSLNPTDGLLKGTPLNQHVTTGDTVEIQVNDGNGGFDTLKYALAIANKGPDFTSIFTDTTITEDDVFAFDIDSDDEGQGDTEYSFTNAVPDWIALDSATGIISGTPLNNHVENFIGLNIKVDDGNGGVKTRTITLSVSNNPTRFTSTISDSVATEDELFTYDADVDDEAQGAGVYSFSGLPAWLSADDTTGILSGTPTNDDIDTVAVTIQFNDGNGSIVEQLIHVIVENANDAPVLTTTATADTIDEDAYWSFQFAAVDIDSAYGDTLSFELRNFPAMMQVDSATGLVFWTPQNSDVGDAVFELWVFDRERASDSLKFRLHINNTNDAPVLTAQADTTAKEDELFIYKIRYEDVDAGDSARFELITAPPSMEIDSVEGIISWTPTNDDRDLNFEVNYSVRDGLGETDVDTFDIFVLNVNDPPVLATLPDYSFAEDSSLTLLFSDWFDKVDDIDNQDTTLSWQVFGLQTTNAIINGDTLTISGPLNWHGPDTGKVVVSDGELTDTTELAIFVTPVNDPPVIDVSFPALISFTEDETTTVNLNDYVADVDNSDLEMNWSVFPVDGKKSGADVSSSNSGLPAEVLVKSFKLSPNRAALVSSDGDSITIVIDPATNIATFYAQPDFYLDGYDFMFVVDDSTVSSDFGRDSVTTTIQVVPANDPPVLSALPELSAAEDSIITVILPDWFEFVNDVDNHDTTLTWSVLDGNFTTAVITASLLLITPQANWFGDDTLHLIATDDELLADTADVVVHFQSVNDPPVFSPLADITIPEDDTLFIELNDYVEDVETADEDLIFTVRRESGNGQVLSNIAVPVAFESSAKKEFLFVSEKLSFPNKFTSAGDSIQITIDEVSHIATICGTLNYYTDFQLFTFYVSDGDAVDSVNVNIAVESVNDKPVLDSLPTIVFQEDSVFVLSLSQWDSLVYDVEDSDDTLRWSFTIDGSIFLNYDSTDKRITLYGAENFNGSSVLTAIVTDLGGLSDTALVDVEILPINDPPQIDSSLFAITFDQKDTVEYKLDDYVSDTDHGDESLVWQFIADDLVYFDYTDTSRSVRFWADSDKFGVDSILAIVTDPMGGNDSQYVVITVTDTTRPSFELAIFQNQLASRYVEIDVFPSELLGANTFIITDGDTLAVQRALDTDSTFYYNATYQIEESGIVQIYVSGVDLAGNSGDLAYEIGVSKISRETGGALTDPDSIMSFLFAADAVPMDLCALFIPYKSEIRPDTGLAKGLFAGDDFPVSDEFDFRIPVSKLDDNARIMFSLDRMQFLQQYATELGIYIWEDDDWQYLTTYTSREKGSYWAYSAKPGIYQIRVNSANPAVVLPEQISIMQNYPNPFNSQTTIRYTIGAGSFVTFDEAFAELVPYDVSIKVYNILGQEVATLVNKPQLPGFYSVTWNGRNKAGKTISTGLYIYQVIIGDKVFHKKMTVLK